MAYVMRDKCECGGDIIISQHREEGIYGSGVVTDTANCILCFKSITLPHMEWQEFVSKHCRHEPSLS